MPSCYIPGCKTGNGSSNSKNPVHIFRISSKADEHTRQKWIQNVPKRTDKPWDFSTCSLCYLHFEDKFIVKTIKVMLGDIVMVEEPRKKWKLADDAVPTVFANQIVPKYYNRKAPQTRNLPKDRVTPTPMKKMKIIDENRNSSPTSAPRIPLVSLGNRCYPPPPLKKNLSSSQVELLAIDKLQKLRLPPGWISQRWEDEEGITLQFCEVLKDTQSKALPTFYTERSLKISHDNRIIAYIRNTNVSSSFPGRLSNVDDVENGIRKLSKVKVCGGAKNMNMVTLWPGAKKRMSVWFSEMCTQVIADGEKDGVVMCKFCGELKTELRKAAEEWLKKRQHYRGGEAILPRPGWMEEKVINENLVDYIIPPASKRIHVIVDVEEEGSSSTINKNY
ncbi:unnamed protein product [Orchesella dallaii]|uniref:THAP-type domain-containing protein n=1 Tax=Orchesella dallaii TaxID=48710 RepID=A0ABP1RUX7_9HEXA